MTADVYAADDDLIAQEGPQVSTRSAAIQVSADAEPDVLLRIAALLNLLNTPPERVAFEKLADDTVTVEIIIRGCSRRAVDLVCRKLLQLTCTRGASVRWDDLI